MKSGNVLRRIFCVGRSVLTAVLLGVMQGRNTKSGEKQTSKMGASEVFEEVR